MEFKTESGAYIKPEPGTAPAFVDEEGYEDTGELSFPQVPQSAWLLRLPKPLHSSWASIAEDEPIQIGTIRHFTTSNRMKLFLNPNVPYNQGASKEYDVRTAVPKSKNTFVFSEKDLPGYKSRIKSIANMKTDDKKDVLAGEAGGINKNTGYNHYRQRKGVPKQTVLAATISREMTANAVDREQDAQTRRLDVEDRKSITLLKGDVRNYARMVIDPTVERTSRGRAAFDTFKTDSVAAKAKSQDNKTARIPQNELLDLIFGCFNKYTYWSMTSLKQELRQPEAYLRSTLMMIAEQVKSGPFNNTWKLKAENQVGDIDFTTMKQEIAPQQEAGEGISSMPVSDNEDDDDDDDDDNDDLEMEDVGP